MISTYNNHLNAFVFSSTGIDFIWTLRDFLAMAIGFLMDLIVHWKHRFEKKDIYWIWYKKLNATFEIYQPTICRTRRWQQGENLHR